MRRSYDFLTHQYPELAAKLKEEETLLLLQNGVTEDEFHELFLGVEKAPVKEFWSKDMIVPV